MRKIAFAFLFSCILHSSTSYALPFGNPSEPWFLNRGVIWGGACTNCKDPCGFWFDTWSIRVGYYGDFVFDRKLKVRREHNDGVKNTRIFTNAGYAVLNLGNRLDIFGTAGVSRIRLTALEQTWGTTLSLSRDSVGTLESNTNFSWSAGARATLFRWGCFNLGVEGQYFRTKEKFDNYVSTFLSGNEVHFDNHNHFTYKEWQAGVGLSYTIACCDPAWLVVPYAGVKWSWVRVANRDFTIEVVEPLLLGVPRFLTIFDLRNQRHFGYALGVSVTYFGNTAFTIEGRWRDEKALYFNVQFRL